LVLLDTHAWVWLLNGSERLGPKAREAIQRSVDEEVVLVSAISPWEVAMLVSKGRLSRGGCRKHTPAWHNPS
jgi:PIN domain nuclease of toxin-antitoxin system